MAYVFGVNPVAARLARGKDGLRRVLVRRGQPSKRISELLDLAQNLGCQIERIDDEGFTGLTGTNHQGIGLEVQEPKAVNEDRLLDIVAAASHDLLFLVLDGVTDPRNLGACLRSAATFGVDAVIVPKDNSAPLNDAAIKTASGAAVSVPLVQVVNLARCLRQLQKEGVWVVGTLLDAEKPLHEVDLKGHIALVMGSEDKGMREKTAKTCDFVASIPMPNPEFGFNVSVASGICLYEAWCQRVRASSGTHG